MADEVDRVAIPLVEERASVTKRLVEESRVRVRTHVDRHVDIPRAVLEREEVEIERVPKEEEVSAPPEVRQEGDVTIVPVVEERLVVEKRLVLVEEIRLKRVRKAEEFSQPVELARHRVEVERQEIRGDN